jgi:hypothetical protein
MIPVSEAVCLFVIHMNSHRVFYAFESVNYYQAALSSGAILYYKLLSTYINPYLHKNNLTYMRLKRSTNAKHSKYMMRKTIKPLKDKMLHLPISYYVNISCDIL